VKSTIRLVVQKGPREGYGRVDLPSHLLIKANDEEIEFYIRELKSQFPVTGVGRYNSPRIVFKLKNNVKIGDLVTVERRLVFICNMCGRRVSSKINGLCDKCYNWHVNGDMVAPPYAALICGRGG
jgi:hypothetical protein